MYCHPRTPDYDMVSYEIARGIALIRWTAYLRRCIFMILPDTAPYTFRLRFNLLPLILLFGDFGRWGCKFQLYLAVKKLFVGLMAAIMMICGYNIVKFM